MDEVVQSEPKSKHRETHGRMQQEKSKEHNDKGNEKEVV
jgi:hypothetical protein